MSSEKDLEAPYGTPGRARAQLHELKSRWGSLRVTEGTEEEPLVIERRSPMGNYEVWKKVSGRGSKSWFELMNGSE